jgi:hypothetical protein
LTPSYDSVAEKAEQFKTTCWSAILLSAQSQAPGSGRPREERCQIYRYPLYAFIRRRGYNAEDASYEIVAEKLGVSGDGVKTLIHRLRKRYSEILRESVAQTVTNPGEIHDETRSPCEALIASEGRLRP